MNVFVYTCALSGEFHFVKERPCTPPSLGKVLLRPLSPCALFLPWPLWEAQTSVPRHPPGWLFALGLGSDVEVADVPCLASSQVGSSKRGGARSMGCPKGEAPYMAYLDYIAM